MHEAYDFQARRNFELDLLLVVVWPWPYNDHSEDRMSCMVLQKDFLDSAETVRGCLKCCKLCKVTVNQL